MITAQEFVELAATWEGVPFHHQGRSRFGVDCVGLPECVLREAGVLPEGYQTPTNYGRIAMAQLIAQLEKWCQKIQTPEIGALIVIRWRLQPDPSHVAIYTGVDLIHAYRPTGRGSGVVRHPYREPWISWTHSIWRAPGVEYP